MSDPTDAPGTGGPGPWWASGSDPGEGLDGRDPFDAHRRARTGRTGGDAPGTGDPGDPSGDDPTGTGAADAGELRALAVEAVDLLARVAAATAQRAGRPRATSATGTSSAGGPHADGRVCDACPVCITLRAVQEARPEVVAHLADAAHHVTAALQAFADAQAGDDGLQHIDLDP